MKDIIYLAFNVDKLEASVSIADKAWCFKGIEQIKQMIAGLDRDDVVIVGHGIRRYIWTLRAIKQGIDHTSLGDKPWSVVTDRSIKTYYDLADGDSVAELQAFAGLAIDNTVKAQREAIKYVLEHRDGDLKARAYLADKYADDSYYSLPVSSLAARLLRAKARTLEDEHRDLPDLPVGSGERDLRDAIAKGAGEVRFGYDAGVSVRVGNGGLHGARESYINKSGNIMLIDVDSMYPSIMMRYDLLSRTADKDIYAALLAERLQAKADGDDVRARALKLVLNATYGAMRCDYSPLYDPTRAALVCRYGQVLVSRLAALASDEAELVQINTDGIIVAAPGAGAVPHVKDWVKMWEDETGLTCSIDVYDAIYQRDVNTYMLVRDGSVVKSKGDLTTGDPLHNHGDIIARAVQAELLGTGKVEDIINDCDDPVEYQMIYRTTPALPFFAADGMQIPDKVVRLFAVRETDNEAVRVIRIRDDHTTCAVAGAPVRAVVHREAAERMDVSRIDKSWYIERALELLDSIMVSKQKKQQATTAANLSRPEIICDFDW